jgi:hypothetical protein
MEKWWKTLKLLKQNFLKVIGNDIVDLALARKESNWKRMDFRKNFHCQEQLLISNAENPEIMVWNLWGKEAAYINSTIDKLELGIYTNN